MNRRRYLIPVMCVWLLFLTGCWDTVDIEKRGFIVGSAIDMADKNENGNYVIKATNQFVVPLGLGVASQGGGEEKAYTDITAKGESLYVINQKMAQLTSRKPFFEHLKVIVVSDKVARKKGLFADVMDIYLRDPEIRRTIKLVVTSNKAKELIDTAPEGEKIPAIYLDNIMENKVGSLFAVKPVDIGTIHRHLLNKSSFVVPLVVKKDKRMKYNGAAVFHGYNNKMIGVLNGKETEGLNLIIAKKGSGTIKIKEKKDIIAYQVEDIVSRIKIDTSDLRHIKVSIKINAAGIISEAFGTKSLLNKKRMDKMQKQIKKEIEKMTQKTIKKAKTLNTDIFGIDRRLKRYHYDKWKKLRKNWDRGENLFSKCTFRVKADVEIRATVSTNKVKD